MTLCVLLIYSNPKINKFCVPVRWSLFSLCKQMKTRMQTPDHQGRISRSIYELPKVLVEPGMTYQFTSYWKQPLKWAYSRFKGGHLQDRIITSLGTPCRMPLWTTMISNLFI
jgi:hypothetical protein